jgi:ABC-type branched-subunit amino acid transport system substrate-binding protein
LGPRPELGAGAASRYPEPGWTNAFFRLVAALVRRPRWSDTPLPLIWLTGGSDGTAVLDALTARLAASPGRYRVPHGRLTSRPDPAAPPAVETEIRPLLDRLCRKLSTPAFGTDRLWFKHYALAAWLMDQDLSALRPDDVPGELTRRLRDRARPRRNGELPDPAADGLFGVRFQLLSWLLRRLVPQALFRVAVSGRIPRVGRTYRWFMCQQYLAPAQSVTFPGFAERLTLGIRDDEPPDQIDKLLVHAFLEDLRQAYLRRPWRIRNWRRTAYPIALVDDVAPGSARYTLLRLINDVRNETGRYDPLLLVCAGERALTSGEALDADELAPAYESWARVLPRTRRARGQGAWVWSIDVPALDGTGGGSRPPSFAPPKPPWFARRTVAVSAVVTLGVALTGVVGVRSGWPGCGHSPLDRTVSVREIGGECIGYSDGDGFVFNNQPGQQRLTEVQRRIHAQNRQVRSIWGRGGHRRPYVTVVYLGTLTGRSSLPNEEAYAAEREELEGLAVAQYDGMRTTEKGTPLLRVVIANAGFQMRHADDAVQMIVDLAHRDPTVVGVVGLVESRTNTGRALRRLNDAGLPAIAPTLSADGMYEYSNLYLQIAPPNRDQARLIGQYARTVLHVSGIHVYYTTGELSTLAEDRYVDTLLGDLWKVFGSRLRGPTEFTSGTSLRAECGYRGMLFFAGRWSEFDSFVHGLATTCGDDPPQHLVADDSVNRYMANPTIRTSAPGTIPLTYVSKAAPATCDRLSGRTNEEAAGRFLRRIRAPDLLSPPRCDPAHGNEPVGERVGLAYDATMIMLRAVQELAERLRREPERQWNPRSITPVAVYTEVLLQNKEKPFPGVTGNITFDPNGEPEDKPISLLQVRSIPELDEPPDEVFQCGPPRSTCRQP